MFSKDLRIEGFDPELAGAMPPGGTQKITSN